MHRYDQELLDTQMRRLEPPQNYGAIAVLLATMFLAGVAIGGVLLWADTNRIDGAMEITMLLEARNQQRAPALLNIEAHEQKRERIRRELELAKQETRRALAETRKLLARADELLAKDAS